MITTDYSKHNYADQLSKLAYQVGSRGSTSVANSKAPDQETASLTMMRREFIQFANLLANIGNNPTALFVWVRRAPDRGVSVSIVGNSMTAPNCYQFIQLDRGIYSALFAARKDETFLAGLRVDFRDRMSPKSMITGELDHQLARRMNCV